MHLRLNSYEFRHRHVSLEEVAEVFFFRIPIEGLKVLL